MAEPRNPSTNPQTAPKPNTGRRGLRLEPPRAGSLPIPTAIQLAKLARTCTSKIELVRRAVEPLVAAEQMVTAWFLSQSDAGDRLQVSALWEDDSQKLWTVVESEVGELLKRMTEVNSASAPLKSLPGQSLHLTPVPTPRDSVDFVCSLTKSRPNTAHLDAWMSAVAAAAMNWDLSKAVENTSQQNETLVQWLGLSHSVLAGADQRTCLYTAAGGIRKITGAYQVAISLCDPDRSNRRLVALSDVETFDATSPLVKQIELAACLPLEGEGEYVWTLATDKDKPQPTLRQYCAAANHEACFAARLQAADGAVIGSILIGGAAAAIMPTHRQAQLRRLVGYLSENLAVTLAARAPLAQRLKQSVRQVLRHRWMKIAAWCAAAFSLAMLIPLPYKIHCDCQLQPMTRRYVSAPFEGVLDEALVKPGDIVKQGQVLARFDGRALRMKLSGLEAQLSGEKNRQKAALAKGDISDSQIATAEWKRLTTEIELLNGRLNELNICSPIDGVIVNGDLDKVQGARLEMGQSLFEVAPLDQMRAEVAIPESEIRFVRPEMQSRILLNAYPYQTWTAPIQRVRPRSEIRGSDSVFIAEVVIANEQTHLRPGMRGQARVTSDFRLLGWTLFHRAWESVRRRLYW